MRNIVGTRFLCQLNQKNQNIQQFYDPLTPTQLLKKKTVAVKNPNCHRILFDQSDDQENILSTPSYPNDKTHPINKNSNDVEEDMFLKKIIANSKKPKKVPETKKIQNSQFQNFSFDKKLQIKYPQTPHFKNQMLSPFWKFNKDNKYNIQTLQKNFNKGNKAEFSPIDIDQDPLLYVTQPIKYFIGLAMKMKQKNMFQECLMFLKLACYTQPYNQKGWKKYIQFVQQTGQISKCLTLSKTAFLFCPTQDFAKIYLTNGQKCGAHLEELKGVITNINNLDLFEKGILVQMGKLCLKYRQNWKGIKILFEICIWNQFKLPVCTLIFFLSKFLQNIGQREKALMILKKSFGKNMSKLQIYTLYLEIKNRQEEGNISQSSIKEVLDYADYISGQNRYKLYLEVAQILFKQNNEKYKHFLEQSYFSAKNYCAPGTGYNKAIRHVFFSVLRWKKVIYPFTLSNDFSSFELNRQRYVLNEGLKYYDFTDWKYFLHYGLQKRDDILLDASRKWPYTGRIIAQWIHCIRSKKPVMEVLKIWRQKIKQVPKSGQLWCQGGRIFTELKDYQNASKCFRYAIHFTPQYGDSFIEQLKILLIKGRFRQIYKLKKIMLVSQPFYGHVWSFLKSEQHKYKLSLSDMWDLAIEQIKSILYKGNNRLFLSNKSIGSQQLTASVNYNNAIQNPNSQLIRVRLFSSYEQIESRN